MGGLDLVKGNSSLFFAFAGLAIALFVGGVVVFQANAAKTPSTLPQDNSNTGSVGNTGNSNGLNGNAQDVYLKALAGSYDKQELVLKKGVPVRLHFTADKSSGCGRQLVLYKMNGSNLSVISRNGEEQVLSFTPEREGDYEFNCGMRMFRGGKIKVVA